MRSANAYENSVNKLMRFLQLGNQSMTIVSAANGRDGHQSVAVTGSPSTVGTTYAGGPCGSCQHRWGHSRPVR